MKKKGKISIFKDRSYLIENQEGKDIKYESNRRSRLNIPAQEIEFEYETQDVKETYHAVYPSCDGNITFVSNSASSKEKTKAHSGKTHGHIKITITDGNLTGVEIV